MNASKDNSVHNGDCSVAVFMAGTHHLPFVRLVDLAVAYARRYPHVQVYLQHGFTPVKDFSFPENMHVSPFFDSQQTQLLQSKAQLLVAHGGPSILMEWLRAGFLPYILPRDPSRAEHVDGHQIRFAKFASAHNLCEVISGVSDLPALSDQTPCASKVSHKESGPQIGSVSFTAARFATVANALLAKHQGKS